jgi:hypothetical protein
MINLPIVPLMTLLLGVRNLVMVSGVVGSEWKGTQECKCQGDKRGSLVACRHGMGILQSCIQSSPCGVLYYLSLFVFVSFLRCKLNQKVLISTMLEVAKEHAITWFSKIIRKFYCA